MKINIASPAYGHSYSSEYVSSLYLLALTLDRRGIHSSFTDIAHSDIVDARNYLISNFYFQTDCTHCLMIDTDMGYKPQLILDMLALDKPVVGVAAPRKSEGFLLGKVLAKGDGFYQVDRCGTGIILITRDAIRAIIEKHPDITEPRQHQLGLPKFIRPFDRINSMSEDVSFCERWKQCSGEIWVSVKHDIKHVGRHVYRGNYLDHLKSQSYQPPISSPDQK